MSTNRKGYWGPRGKGPNGRKLCYCGCGEELSEVLGNRRTSIPGHYERWAAVNNPATVRRLVYERDHGICALCGADTEGRRREMVEYRALWRWLADRHARDLLIAGQLSIYPGFTPMEKRYYEYRIKHEDGRISMADATYWADHWVKEQISEKFSDVQTGTQHTWEADHIIPVIEGGGECGLDGYRTLCLSCHKKETAKLAARRAEKRKGEKVAQTTLP